MENKKEDKYLEPMKDGFFAKVSKFLKSIFSKKNIEETGISVVKEEKSEQVVTNTEIEEQTYVMKQDENIETTYVDIKTRVAEIQKRYETEGYDLTLLTNEEYEELKLLYQEQISSLNRRYENRVRELKTVRTKIQKLQLNA